MFRRTKTYSYLAAATVVVAAVSAVVVPAHAAIIPKADNNPKGVPDFGQGPEARCAAAAWADAMWYFDQVQGKTGLVEHKDPSKPKEKWFDAGDKLVDALDKQIRENKHGSKWGTLRYIYSKRKTDLVKETRNNKEYDVFTWSMGALMESSITHDTMAQAVNANVPAGEHAKTFGVLGFMWHEKDKDLMPLLKDNGTPVGNGVLLGHEMAVAGLDSDKAKLVVSHGHGDHRNEPNRAEVPVSSADYNQYTYAMNGAAAARRMRLTDLTILRELGGLQGRIPDYAEADHLLLLRSDTKNFLSKANFETLTGAGPGNDLASTAETTHVSTSFYNESAEPLTELSLELPLLSPQSFSIGDLEDVQLPSGWSVQKWDPDMGEPGNAVFQDDYDSGVLTDYGFAGLRFFTTDPGAALSIGQDLSFAFDLDSAMLRPITDDMLLNTGARGADMTSSYAGVTVVPEPSAAMLCMVAIARVVRRRRRAELA